MGTAGDGRGNERRGQGAGGDRSGRGGVRIGLIGTTRW